MLLTEKEEKKKKNESTNSPTDLTNNIPNVNFQFSYMK